MPSSEFSRFKQIVWKEYSMPHVLIHMFRIAKICFLYARYRPIFTLLCKKMEESDDLSDICRNFVIEYIKVKK